MIKLQDCEASERLLREVHPSVRIKKEYPHQRQKYSMCIVRVLQISHRINHFCKHTTFSRIRKQFQNTNAQSIRAPQIRETATFLRAAASVSCRSRKRFPPPETQRRDESFASISNQDPPSKPAAGEESIGLADTLTRRISSPASLSSER